jgi:hypothetical protein
MGRILLILLLGFAASFGILAQSKSNRYMDSVDRVVAQFSSYSANNASTSGAYMALNRLFRNIDWRTGYNNLILAGDTFSVVIQDNSIDAALGPNRIRIRSTGRNKEVMDLTQVMIWKGKFGDFAIWAKDSVTNVTTKDSLGNVDPNLLVENAPFMPNIDEAGMISEAVSQGHQQAGGFEPNDGYPEEGEDEDDRDFYYDDVAKTPHVTHVQGDFRVRGGRTVYGIFLIEGNAYLEGNSRVQGVLVLPNPSSTVIHGGGNPSESSVTGGVLTWGTVDGTGNHISVTFKPSYLGSLIKEFLPDNPPMRVLSWQ